MKKNIGLFVSLSLLLMGSFAYGLSCSEIENTIEAGNDCYCKEGFTWNDGKTKCTEVDTSLRDAELKKAIERMYENGLTHYNTIETFGSDKYLTREQASKFFVTFYSSILGKKLKDNINSKAFSDINEANPDLRYYISQADDLGLFRGINGKFIPKNKLTQAQAIAVAIRMINGNQEEPKNSWYINYYNMAKRYGLLKRGKFDIIDLNRINITRGDTALVLFTLYNHIINSKDTEKLADYSNNLANALNKCLEAEDENIVVFEDGTEEEMNNAITKIVNTCEESAKEVDSIGPWGNDDSLQKAILTVVSYNVLFYNKARAIIPYKHIESLTEEQEIKSNEIDKELKGLIENFDKSYEELRVIQKEFSNNYKI